MPGAKGKHYNIDLDYVRKRMEGGSSVQEIASEYGCTTANIYHLLRKDDRIKHGLHGKGFNGSKIEVIPNVQIDQKTGLAVTMDSYTTQIVGKIGDKKITEFVKYHMEMMQMRQGCDLSNVPDLYARFYRYLQYCAEHCIVPNNMNAYYAIGIAKSVIYSWSSGKTGSPEQRKFAEDIRAFFASVHEQGATDGVINPISSMWFQKSHDGMVEASKLEQVEADPLGDRRSASEIAKAYEDVELPD